MGGVICKNACTQFGKDIDGGIHESPQTCPWYSNVEVDWNGCRKFPRLPPPGQHPRLFFTAEEIPRIVARFTHSEMAPTFRRILNDSVRTFMRLYEKIDSLSKEEKMAPRERETIDEFFKADSGRDGHTLAAYAYGIMFDEPDLAAKAKKAAVFYAKVILRSQELAVENNLKCHPYKFWHSDEWNLEIGWLFGGHSYAFLYDVIYNDISEEDRAIMRKAIANAARGRRGWGMGWSTRRIQSNWAPYHGDLLALNAVIEEEEGFDREVFTIFSDLMVHYMDYAFYDSGHAIEDSYALNVGLREGSLCFLIMARRGHNIFNHPHYKKIWTEWLPYALEPNNSGNIYGGSSGNIWIYPTSAIVAKYMFPRDQRIDFIYRHYMCENGAKFARLTKVQSRVAALAFAIPALSPNLEEGEHPGRLELPLDFVCRDRGKVIMRSDWSEEAMWFTLDARPDGFLIGHDVCSRGAFVLNVSGRSWGFCPEWKWFDESNDYSLPCIDDVGQKNKAPFVKLLDMSKGLCDSTFASADITYAYNYKWTSWAKEGEDWTGRGFEVEPNDPRDFGYNVWWAPHKLHGERNVAFVGLHQWRKRFACVEKVIRSAMLVRSKKPFVIVADEVKKDEGTHKYSWAMTTPEDVSLGSYEGTDVILSEDEGVGRRLLVRSLCRSPETFDCNFRQIEKYNKSGSKVDTVRQLVMSCDATEMQFIFLLYSLPELSSIPPSTTWEQGGNVLTVEDSHTGQRVKIEFGKTKEGAVSMDVLEGTSD